jgi:hypothetical protein
LWTSGTADGIGCEQTWGWCPSSQPFYDNFTWGQSLNSKPGVENCAAIAWSTGNAVILVDQVCSEKRGFICEVVYTLMDITIMLPKYFNNINSNYFLREMFLHVSPPVQSNRAAKMQVHYTLFDF